MLFYGGRCTHPVAPQTPSRTLSTPMRDTWRALFPPPPALPVKTPEHRISLMLLSPCFVVSTYLRALMCVVAWCFPPSGGQGWEAGYLTWALPMYYHAPHTTWPCRRVRLCATKDKDFLFLFWFLSLRLSCINCYVILHTSSYFLPLHWQRALPRRDRLDSRARTYSSRRESLYSL